MKDGHLSTAWKIAVELPWSEWFWRGIEFGRTTVGNDEHLPKKSRAWVVAVVDWLAWRLFVDIPITLIEGCGTGGGTIVTIVDRIFV